MARYKIGTSGYSYKEWKGNFYPESVPDSGMLRYYAERFNTVACAVSMKSPIFLRIYPRV